jgi:hypothetical protein
VEAAIICTDAHVECVTVVSLLPKPLVNASREPECLGISACVWVECLEENPRFRERFPEVGLFALTGGKGVLLD